MGGVPRLASLLLALALPALLAACGGGGGAAEGAASSDPCAKDAVVIHMKDIKFQPETASAKVGQPVCWVNDDDVAHDAVDEEGHAFHSELYGQGKTFTTKLTTAGTISYVCTVHPGMTGELDVKP
jgi:plastocyanin